MLTTFYTSVSILNVSSNVFILFDKGMLLKETIHAILLTMGVWSSGYDSCFGCRRSRVQIPDRPYLLIFVSKRVPIFVDYLCFLTLIIQFFSSTFFNAALFGCAMPKSRINSASSSPPMFMAFIMPISSFYSCLAILSLLSRRSSLPARVNLDWLFLSADFSGYSAHFFSSVDAAAKPSMASSPFKVSSSTFLRNSSLSN